MSSAVTEAAAPLGKQVHPSRLFVASCMSLISTAMCFAVLGGIAGPLKGHFVLSNEQVGLIGGAGLWGFTISMFLFGAFVDVIGMRTMMFFALASHVTGVLVMMFATGFNSLFAGALILALGNGTVEAFCNPLIATLYSKDKTTKLNQFHVWFPGGIVIGGLLCFAVGTLYGKGFSIPTLAAWQVMLALILVPTVIYGFLFMGQVFPKTERVQSGLSFGDMVKGAFSRPLFWIALICMAFTASLELGPGRWIPAVLEAGGMHGILVMSFIFGIMALMRFFGGGLIHRFSPPGVIAGGAVLAGAGLFMMSSVQGLPLTLVAAALFALGVCFFWPTMLGLVAERVPKSGSLGLAMMGGMGMLAVGMLIVPKMGTVADHYLYENLDKTKATAVVQKAVDAYPVLARNDNELFKKEVTKAVQGGHEALKENMPKDKAANAMRGLVANAPRPDAKTHKAEAEQVEAITKEINDILGPADNAGGLMSFRFVAILAGVIAVVFGAMFLRDKAKGGYKAEDIHA